MRSNTKKPTKKESTKQPMFKLFSDTLKFMGKCAKTGMTHAYARRLDLSKGTGFLYTLLTGNVGSNKGARFLSESEQLKIFSPSGKGLLIDGKNKHLSLDESFKHLLLVAQTGAGKTTKFIIPNVLQLAENKNSIIVTDPSGEIFSLTSGYMQKKGFRVLKFDPTDPERSIYFNPLRYVFSYSKHGEYDGEHKEQTYINQVKLSLLATSLVASCLPGAQDAFWKAGAESLIEFFTACLKNTPKECHNLYNVYKLIEAMTPDGKLLEEFMLTYVHDPKLKDKWISLLSNFNSTFRSHFATAQTALKALGNEHVARMLSKNSISFKSLRTEKTILYLTFPVNEASFYTFILNLFYTQLFHEYMSELPTKKDLPIFILYDEFGHANIPNFDMVATNIRKYKVSLSLVLQSLSQLENQYGENGAKTIIEGGVNSKLFYSGAGLDTAFSIQQMLGKVIRDEFKLANNSTGERLSRQEFNLLNADEIRTLPDSQAFFITGNKNPILLDVVPYYQNRKFKNKHRLGAAYIKPNRFHKFQLVSVLDTLWDRETEGD